MAHGWMLATIASAIVVAVVILWPERPPRGDYDFSGAIFGMFRLLGGIIALLVIWLIYFAAR
jgi:hypothetical protein